MPKKRLFIGCFVLVAGLMGCAGPGLMAPRKPPAEARSKEDYRNEYLKRAAESERLGDWVSALKNYKIATTISPENKEAIDGRDRVEAALRRLAEEHYRYGLDLHKKGQYGKARTEFLTTLRLWPEHPEALQMLTTRKRVVPRRYIVHTIKPGESLSMVAKMYYGDYFKFPIIAKYNDMEDATSTHVGQKIKVPEIEGIPFSEDKGVVKTEERPVEDLEAHAPLEREYEGYPESELKKEQEEEAEEKEEEPIDQMAIYRDHGIDLFEKGQYEEAVIEFDKVLAVQPNDTVSLDYGYQCYFQLALTNFKNKEYLPARDRFLRSLKYNSECQQCHGYIVKSETLYKEAHYKNGMQFYGQQELSKAIEEWEMVRRIDPEYKKVDDLVKKARLLQQKLDEIKRSQENQ